MRKLLLFAVLLINVLSSAQITEANVTTLKKWSIINGNQFATKTNFTISENGKTKSCFLSINNQTVEMKDAETKQVIEKYQNSLPALPPSSSNCTVQEANQWAAFKNGIYLKILAQVNKTCKAQKYCLMIYCNKIPVSSYMLLIKPTAKCPVEEVNTIVKD